MRENRTSGSEGGEAGSNRPSLPLSVRRTQRQSAKLRRRAPPRAVALERNCLAPRPPNGHIAPSI